ncbi:Hpt domain protein [Roseivivax jejudonensis]|uniref:Hpt domain protein n=1 Tax=Roseivivax jejudonensis TaxID=1529041 RepID=A0A1X6ZQ24_9RHOB|nr:Hpt domain-containing protein [Roseivivax jejudonensis]SLN57819.1 Hpt domain protein [Roseivivax jejudonensis]
MIDWDQVLALRTEIGAEAFDEVAALFLSEVAAALDALSPDAPDLAAKLHFLKGSALDLGLRDFAALCSAGEAQAAAGARPDGLDRLRPLFDASRVALEQGLTECDTR